ncbi:MAG: 4Fe-4S binding protein [Lachnospiraceae bacterium]|nr:4Fe-4S binding protein [Lachnospiraceae bacterium]
MHGILNRLRLWVQIAFTAITNGYVNGFSKGSIYTGNLKHVCVPGLSCYSCPGALGSCPIGSLQAVLGSKNFKFSFYLLGFFMLIGGILGRFVCGWLCPFGLFQDLLYKIPFMKKIKKLPGDKFLLVLKYIILAVFVILLPLFAVDFIGQGSPWFCKYICPSGTLMGGIPLYILNDGIRQTVGWLYVYKVSIFIAIVVLSVLVYRPFCRYLCPLGAIYGFFNPIALTRFKIDQNACISCGKCRDTCPLDIYTKETPNNMLCIRCGDCKRACPVNAIQNVGCGLTHTNKSPKRTKRLT